MDWTCGVCNEDGNSLPFIVCRSAAGFYIGRFCDGCGPYSRESGYYPTRESAEIALKGAAL